jgi:hypothetical protein
MIRHFEYNDLVKLSVDVYKGTTANFSKDEAENALRQSLIDLNGGSTKINYKNFRRNKVAIFEATEEVLGVLITEGITNQFQDFVEVRNLAFGDTEFFEVEDYRLFTVATVAAGNGNIERQRLDRQPFRVTTGWKAVKIYEELERFLSAKIDWAYLVNKIARSFNAQIAADIYAAIGVAYNALTTPYIYTGTADRTQLNTLVNHIEAATQQTAVVYGTKLALQQFSPQYVALSGSMVDDRNDKGYFAEIDGTNFVMIKQAHTPGTDSFAISDNFVLVVPQGEEKIVKLVMEGEPLIEDTQGNRTMNADRTIEYEFGDKYGVGVVTSTRYGAYVLS